MKEAAGEANMTVITIILIGVIAAVAIPIVNNAMKTTALKGCCNTAGGQWGGKDCDFSALKGKTQTGAQSEYDTCKTEAGY